jgi:carboxyl-terminal processing protease
MRQRLFRRVTWLVVLVLAVYAAPVQGQLRFLPAKDAPAIEDSTGDGIDGLLRRAEKLESERRWGEALAVYEDALREHPDEPLLGTRHNLAKIHYDLGRRYSDSSYLRALSTMTERQALSLYSEVLVKIESHYVAAPDWTALVARGTQSLSVAMHEPGFQKQNLRGRQVEQFNALFERLRRTAQARPLQTRQQAIEAVTATVTLARQQQLPPTAIALEFACGAIGALDSYSSYLTSDQLNDVYSQIEGNFVGLGIELKANSGSLQIVKVITGSPAERAGIHAGDRIAEVDGKNTADLTTDQAADLLQGQEGTVVQIAIVAPEGPTRRLSIRREHVDVPSVDDVKIIDRDYGVGYLKLTCFQKTTSRDLDAAMWKLNRAGMRSLIIDLRGNPGGLLTSSVEVADKFVDEGVIVSTRGRSPLEDFNYTAHKPGTWSTPLIVLIDGESASASEIFAGAIKDHHRGQLVGERSYGKGSVQGIFPLSAANSGVRLTTAKFYSPNGNPISNVGVKPDLEVRRVAKPANSQLAATDAGDAMLDAAVQAAKRQTAQR